MKLKSVVCMSVFAVCVFLCSQIFPETIYLKDGRVIEEKIIERHDYYIITMAGNFPHRYYMDQIDYIEEDQAGDTKEGVDIDFARYEDIPEEKVKLIVAFIDASGVRRNMEKNIEHVINRVQEEKKEKFRELFNIDEIIERLVPVYNKYYTEEELKEIIQFYQSPAGQKILDVTPLIMKEAVGVSIQYFKDKATL